MRFTRLLNIYPYLYLYFPVQADSLDYVNFWDGPNYRTALGGCQPEAPKTDIVGEPILTFRGPHFFADFFGSKDLG